ncbi:F-box-like domain-containing protein [Microdochium nivale]|nr:F-box-like domain-containing protein [Microdochium nivale]
MRLIYLDHPRPAVLDWTMPGPPRQPRPEPNRTPEKGDASRWWSGLPWRMSWFPEHPATSELRVYRLVQNLGEPQGTTWKIRRGSGIAEAGPEIRRSHDEADVIPVHNHIRVGATATPAAASSPSLPPELVAMVLSAVLHDTAPAGRIFLFHPAPGPARFRREHAEPPRFRIAEQYTRHPPTVDLTRYALVCRAWRDLAYAHFYGGRDNSFHFSVLCPAAAVGFMRHPGGDSDSGGGDRRGGNVDDTRTAAGAETGALGSDEPTCPLTTGTGPWVARATIRVDVPRRQCAHENDILVAGVAHAVVLLGGQDTRLTELSVQLTYRHGPQVVKFCRRPETAARASGVDVVDDRGEEEDEPDTLEFATTGCYDAPKGNTTARVLLPLLRLRGLRSFSVGGLVTDEFAGQLTTAVMRGRGGP